MRGDFARSGGEQASLSVQRQRGSTVHAITAVVVTSMVTPNLNHGQDTRANRTQHTTSSSTHQPHAKQQLTKTRTQTRAGEVRARWSPAHPYPSSTFTCPRRASIDAFTSQGPGPARPRRRGPELCLEHCLLPFLPPPTLSRDERARARTSGARDEERQRGIRAGRVGFRYSFWGRNPG